MSVAFARAVVDGMRRHGIRVHEHGGCWSRGNGQSSAYAGAVVHHTAGSFDGGMSLLVGGRSDLPGPLCNMAGHANGDITLVAAHPANHAGASGGRSMGPLPVSRSFNRLVWGLEIMYPGTVPMTAAQYRTAQIMCGVVSGILRRPNPEWARAHAETSITGKWDPGYANGRTIDMAAFRGDVWGALNSAGPAPGKPAAPPPKKVKPVIISESLHHGKNYVRLPGMVGSASGLYGKAWLSVSALGGGTVTNLFQKNTPRDGAPDGVAGERWNGARIRNGSRVWLPVPSGTEFIELWVDVLGADTADPDGSCGFASVEFDPK